MTTYLVFIKEIFYIRKHSNTRANNADLGSFVSCRTTNFLSLEGSHFVIWGLLEIGLVYQAPLDFQALFVKEVFTEGVQASEVLAQTITPSVMPINLVGVLAPSDVLTIDFLNK